MQVTETLSEGLKRAYTVVVSASDIEGRRTAKLSDVARTLKMPGFRPGKVPMTVVKQRYAGAVMAEVLEESVSEATRQVLNDRGLRPAGQPKVDLVSVPEMTGAATDLSFTVALELLPDITIPDLGTISLTRLKAKPAEDAVDKALDSIATRQRDLVAVEEDRGAEKGEVLTSDFVGTIDGVAFPGGTATDTQLEVAGSGFIPGFTEQLEGMKAGENRTIEVTFPADYGSKELAGKTAQFAITAKALLTQVKPAIDDDFARKLGLETVEKLREIVSEQIQREYDQLSRLNVKRALLDALADRADFGPPESMVDAEFGQIWQRVEADLKDGKADDEDKGKDEATLKDEYRAIAIRRVRLGLLLSEIGRTNSIQVGDEELTRAMRMEAGRYPGQEAQVIEFFRKNPQAIESLRGPIFEDKVVDFVLELAQVEDKDVTPEELVAAPQGASA